MRKSTEYEKAEIAQHFRAKKAKSNAKNADLIKQAKDEKKAKNE